MSAPKPSRPFPVLRCEQLQAAGSPNRLIRINAPSGAIEHSLSRQCRCFATAAGSGCAGDSRSASCPQMCCRISWRAAIASPTSCFRWRCASSVICARVMPACSRYANGYGGTSNTRSERPTPCTRHGMRWKREPGYAGILPISRSLSAGRLNIPARFVTGYAKYAEPPPDFHAVFEAYLDGAWYLFDPTELSPVSDLVRIGTGRDASEVAFATFFGSARLRCLSPLAERASEGHPAHKLVPLQQPGDGILLAA